MCFGKYAVEGKIPRITVLALVRGYTGISVMNVTEVYYMTDINRLSCDFLVGGAGISGICAAVQAGRLGLKTILVEKEMVLGGNGGPNLGVGAHACMACNPYWNETGIIEELEERVNYRRARIFPTNFGYNIHPQWDRVVTEMLEEAGVVVLRRHLIHGVEIKDNKIVRVYVLNIENLKKIDIEVNGYVLDSTGDAFIASLAGADCRMGRESKAETGERSAPEKADDIISTASVTALVVDSGVPCDFIPPEGTPPWNPEKPDNHFNPNRKIHFLWQVDEGGESFENHSLYTPQELYIRLTYRIYSVWNYLKNIKYPEEAKNHQLVWISPILGRRESRRILGDYLLTETDIEACKTFPDAIGFGGSFLDEHLPSYDGGYEVRFYARPLPYDIPLRSIYSRNILNLFSGGRAISASHLAFTSARLMRTGGMLGQAAVVAAKMCMDKNITPRVLANSYANELQQELLKQDVWVIGVKGEDSANLVKNAKITASSEARLSVNKPEGKWVHAAEGLAAAVYSYPDKVEKVSFYIKNSCEKTATVEGFLGYGKTAPIELLPVPQLFFNDGTKRYEEKKSGRQNALSHEGTTEQPAGRQGWAHYCTREDNITDFEVLSTEQKTIPAGFEGWIGFGVTNPEKFPAFDRKVWGQAAILGIKGEIEVLVGPYGVDVAEGLGKKGDRWVTNHESIAVFKVEPDPIPGNAANVVNGYIHREGRAHLHQWMSAPDAALPQWIQLELEEEETIGSVLLRFDVTERYWRDMYLNKGEKAARRCVADYRVEMIQVGEWKTVISEKDNYLRVRKYVLDQPVKTKTIRLTVDRIWGEGQPARVYEIFLEKK